MINRRTLLAGSAVFGLAATKAFAAPESAGIFGPVHPFSFEMLTAWAQKLSRQPFQEVTVQDSGLLESLNYDNYQQIKFRPDLAIWAHGEGSYPVEPFHISRCFKQPVRIFVVSANGLARELLYSSGLFTWGSIGFAESAPSNGGFAGFRVLTPP